MRTTKYPGLRRFVCDRLKAILVKELTEESVADRGRDADDVKLMVQRIHACKTVYQCLAIAGEVIGDEDDPDLSPTLLLQCFIPDFVYCEVQGVPCKDVGILESRIVDPMGVAPQSMYRVFVEHAKQQGLTYHQAAELFDFTSDVRDEAVNEVYDVTGDGFIAPLTDDEDEHTRTNRVCAEDEAKDESLRGLDHLELLRPDPFDPE